MDQLKTVLDGIILKEMGKTKMRGRSLMDHLLEDIMLSIRSFIFYIRYLL